MELALGKLGISTLAGLPFSFKGKHYLSLSAPPNKEGKGQSLVVVLF